MHHKAKFLHCLHPRQQQQVELSVKGRGPGSRLGAVHFLSTGQNVCRLKAVDFAVGF